MLPSVARVRRSRSMHRSSAMRGAILFLVRCRCCLAPSAMVVARRGAGRRMVADGGGVAPPWLTSTAQSV